MAEDNLIETVMDWMPSGIFVKDARQNFKFIVWNREMERLIGAKRGDVIGKTDYDLFTKAEADYYRATDLGVFTGGKLVEIPEEWVSAPTGPIPCNTKKVPVFGSDGKPWLLVGILNDISLRKELESRVEHERVKVMAASKLSALGEMAGGIAHEINNPLAIIHGRVEKILRLIERGLIDNDKIKEELRSLLVTSERISNIIRGLRKVAREGDKDPFLEAKPRDIIEETLGFCHERLRAMDIEVRVGGNGLDTPFACREVQISQVLLNLISNSKDAVAELKERWIDIQAVDEKDHVRIVVTDSGAGIEKALREKIMAPFFTTKEVGKGTGLGLSISDGIAKEHGGTLTLDASSKHTRFVLEIPKHCAAALQEDAA